jgi:hypothetical protein
MKDFGTKVARSCVLLGGSLLIANAHAAGTIDIGEGRSVSIGAGLRAGFSSVEDAAPSGSDDSSSFSLQSARLYVSGAASETIKFTFNTECVGCVFGEQDPIGSGGDIDVLDAIAQFELKPELNIWIGRMLTPADRIEMNGPYYGLSWNQYNVPLLPSDDLGDAGLLGRDDGVTVWGATGKFQYAVGLFDGVDGGPNQEDNLLFATRLAYNFLTMESNPGYYTSGTYFGTAGDIFTLALSYQSQADAVGTAAAPADYEATIVDLLYENALSGGAAITVEAEYKMLDTDTSPLAIGPGFFLFDGDSYYVTAAYLLPSSKTTKYQPYIRFVSTEPDTAGSEYEITELGLNIVFRGHNGRLNLNYTSTDPAGTASSTDGLSFGVQIQI